MPYSSGLLQHTVAYLVCPKFLTFRPWVPTGSLLPSEHQALALSEASATFPLLSKHCACLGVSGGEVGHKPGVTWEGTGLLICSQGPLFRKSCRKRRVVIESI